MKFILFIIVALSIILGLWSKNSKTKSYSRYLNRFKNKDNTNWPLVSKSTPAQDWRGSETSALGNHNIDCGIGALTQFHLQRVGNPKYKFDYKCINPKNCDESCENQLIRQDKKKCKYIMSQKTMTSKTTKKWTNYLDRQNVMCPKGTVLGGFSMHEMNPLVHYHFRCCPANLTNCKSYSTTMTDFGDYGTIYLDRQIVKTPNIYKQAMTGFKLNTDYGKHSYTYQVSYCDLVG